MKFERLRRGVPRRALLIGIAVFFPILLAGLFLIDTNAHRGEVFRNVEVAAVDVSGLSGDALTSRLDAVNANLAGTPVDITIGGRTDTRSAADVGLTIDLTATRSAALDAHRGSVLLRPFRWLSSFVSTSHVDPAFNVDRDAAVETLTSLDAVENSSDATLEVQDGMLVATGSTKALTPDVDAFVAQLLDSARAGENPIAVEVPLIEGIDERSLDAMSRLAAEVNTLTENGVTVRVGDAETTITAADLRPLLDVTVVDDEIELDVDDDALVELIEPQFPSAVSEGSDVTFFAAFGAVAYEGGDPMTRCCAENSGDLVAAALTAGRDEVTLELLTEPRPHGAEWADSLGITELVGSFTTRYTPGQSRVTNIVRISELTRGVVIEPGQTFSVNEFIGRRTTENGFVGAGVIYNGEFTEDVGGGISQYATTLFNAAFFAGLDFGEYQSHSIYISRYPYGREATLSFPHPDLQIVNSTPYGVLIWPKADRASITVELYSTAWAVGQQTGQSETERGVACTRVTTERTRTYVDDGHTVVDSVIALYRPEGVRCDGSSTSPAPPAPPATQPVPTVPAPPPVPQAVPASTVPAPPAGPPQ